MNAKEYIEEMKQKYDSPRVWAAQQRCYHFQAAEDGDIDVLDHLFLERLKECSTWEYAEEIAKVYIIG